MADWNALYVLAESQAGYFSLSQALEVGFTKPLISYHAKVRNLGRVAHGIYRLTQFPKGEAEDLVVLWIWSKHEGAFSHETALVLQRLSRAKPARVHMTVPVSWSTRRLKVPANLTLHFADLRVGELERVGNVPVTRPLRTIRDCLDVSVPPERIERALSRAKTRKLLNLREIAELKKRLRSPQPAVP